MAGLTTAVMLVPQAMAYAMLAGLPPITGLYAATASLAMYMLFGTSRQLSVGPAAMDSLLVAAGVSALAAPGSSQYIAYAVLLAAMVGVMQAAMGLFRLGFVVNLLSLPVISGFTSAAAIIIGTSQIAHLLGIHIPRARHVHETLVHAIEKWSAINPATLATGLGSIAIMIALRKWRPMVPGALIVVVLGSLAVWLLGLDSRGVAIVGQVPSGLPLPALPVWDPEAMGALLPTAATLALVAFMEAISAAKAFARRYRYDIDANQELIALGMANLGAALVRGYPVAGGLSRTAVNAQAGARTQLASLVTAAVIALTLLMFTPLFHHLPGAVLAAIIMSAAASLIDVAEMQRLYRVNRVDLAMLLITFAATLALGIQTGIALGVAASLAWFIIKASRPHIAVLGRLPGTAVYRNVERFPEVETFPGMLLVRVDAPMYFGNAAFLKRTLSRLEAGIPGLHTLIIDASGIGDVDATADAALHELAEDHHRRGVALVFAGATGPVRDVMARSGLRDRLGMACFYRTVEEAAQARLAGASCADEVAGRAHELGCSPAASPGDRRQ